MPRRASAPASAPSPTRRRLLRAAAAQPLAVALALAARPAAAVEPLTQHDVVLLQPGNVLSRRVDDGALAAWLEKIGAAAAATIKAHPSQLPTAGFIALAVKPGGRMKAWYDFHPPLAPATTLALDQSFAAVPVVPVREGPVVVGLRVSVWGARAPATHAPAPEEWRAVARQAGHPLPLDDLIQAVWPG